jgi:hypothetical protein
VERIDEGVTTGRDCVYTTWKVEGVYKRVQIKGVLLIASLNPSTPGERKILSYSIVTRETF